MPYKNIVFAKLEKRLFNDYRWYMMSEPAQLNYIRFIMFACETYNKIPKNLEAIKRAFKTNQDVSEIESTIGEIKANFPKFKENKHFYYFVGFDEKTNYISKREIPRKSQGSAGDGVDKEEEEDKDKEKDKYKDIYMDFVKLSKDEYKKLVDKYGKEIISRYIYSLNSYIGSKGKRYKSHYFTILSWLNKDKIVPKPKEKTKVELTKMSKVEIDEMHRQYEKWLDQQKRKIGGPEGGRE